LGSVSELFPPPLPANGLAGLGAASELFGLGVPSLGQTLLTAPALPVHAWQFVRRRFDRILDNIAISTVQREDGERKQAGVRSCLNRHYWGTPSDTANSMLIGSWGKDTRGHPSRDIDILFLLPPEVYHRFQDRDGNRQSQLLQEVKNVLVETYSQTTMRGDGQVVSIPFNTIPIEVAIGFRFSDQSIRICDTNDRGNYRISTAEAELADLNVWDASCNGNARPLVRMLKRWQGECNVPLKSFQLERLAIEFLQRWPYSLYDRFWYDWMMRDFFAYLISRANGSLVMPGTGEIVPLGSEWLSRAQTAYRNGVSACENERDNYEALAGQDWQNILGGWAAPILVS
jgi:hypothetical protein